MALKLATPADVTPFVTQGSIRPEQGAFIDSLIGAASARIIKYTGRVFAPEPTADTSPPVTKTFTVRGSYVRVPDLRSVTSVAYNGITLDPTYGYELWGADGEPSTHVKVLPGAVSPFGGAMRPTLAITGRWGFTAVPDDIKDACCLWVARRFKAKDANYADTVMQGVEGAAFQYFNQIPVDVKMTLDAYRQQARVAIV